MQASSTAFCGSQAHRQRGRSRRGDCEGAGSTCSTALPLGGILRGRKGLRAIRQSNFRTSRARVRNQSQQIASGRLHASRIGNRNVARNRGDADGRSHRGGRISCLSCRADHVIRGRGGKETRTVTCSISDDSALCQHIGNIELCRRSADQAFGDTRTNGVVLISRQCHGSQNTDDRHDDHQFDQGKALLQITLHKYSKESVKKEKPAEDFFRFPEVQQVACQQGLRSRTPTFGNTRARRVTRRREYGRK